MTLLLGSLACIVAACAWFAGVHWAAARLRAASAQRLRAKFRDVGLEITGDPYGDFRLAGSRGDVALALASRDRCTLPGASGEDGYEIVSRVEFPVSLPDQIACRVGDVDKTMGPLPSVPRVRTGDERFDVEFATFVGSSGRKADHEGAQSYRDASRDAATAWAHATVTARLRELELRWFRVRDGRAELVFRTLTPEDALRAFDVAANLALAASGRTAELLPVAAGPRRQEATLPDVLAPLRTAVMAVLFTFPLGGLLAFASPFRAACGEDVCGVGGSILVSSSDSSDGGTNYGLYCSNGPNTSLVWYGIACLAAYAATLLLIAAIVSTNRLGRVHTALNASAKA